jgi:hypothetical protein
MVITPVVHIIRRLDWGKVREAEKDIADDASVTAPAPNRLVDVDRSYSAQNSFATTYEGRYLLKLTLTSSAY